MFDRRFNKDLSIACSHYLLAPKRKKALIALWSPKNQASNVSKLV